MKARFFRLLTLNTAGHEKNHVRSGAPEILVWHSALTILPMRWKNHPWHRRENHQPDQALRLSPRARIHAEQHHTHDTMPGALPVSPVPLRSGSQTWQSRKARETLHGHLAT